MAKFPPAYFNGEEDPNTANPSYPAMVATDDNGNTVLIGSGGNKVAIGATNYKKKAILLGDSITAYNGLTTPGSAGNASIVSSNGVATVTSPNHQIVVGQTVWVYGSSVTEQNGFQTVVSVTSANIYTYNHGTGSGTADSVIIQNPLRKNADGLFTWFNALSSAPYTVVRNYGSPGAQTSTVNAIIANHWKDDDADEAFVMIGINDITNDIPLATMIANATQTFDFLLSKGLILNILTTLPLYSSHASFSAARMKVLHSFIEWEKQYALEHNNCVLIDTHSVVVDPTSVTGSAKVNYLNNHIHPDENCAYLCGLKMKSVKFDGQTMTPPGRWPMGALDGQDQNTDSWNLLQNPMMLEGAGGTANPVSGGPVGTIAEGVTANHTVASGSSFTCSLVARSDGGNDQRGVFVSTADAQQASFSYASVHALLVPGATYKIGGNCKLSNAVNLDYLFFEVALNIGTFAANVRAMTQGAGAATTYENFPTASVDLWLESEEFVMPAGAVTTATVTVKLLSSGVGGATLDLGKPKFELVRY